MMNYHFYRYNSKVFQKTSMKEGCRLRGRLLFSHVRDVHNVEESICKDPESFEKIVTPDQQKRSIFCILSDLSVMPLCSVLVSWNCFCSRSRSQFYCKFSATSIHSNTHQLFALKRKKKTTWCCYQMPRP